MSELRKILLVGLDPYMLRSTMHSHGFSSADGYEIIEAGGAQAALAEMEHNEEVVGVVTYDKALLGLLRGHPKLRRLDAVPVVVVAKDPTSDDNGRVRIWPLADIVSSDQLELAPTALRQLIAAAP